MKSVDINCDMGEGMPNDADLMPFISSANIACAYHAGDEATMHATVQLALKHGVSIGAHPGFNDKANFGRTEMRLSLKEVYALVTRQIEAMLQVCSKENAQLRHVKPHGALYNMAARDQQTAAAIAHAIYDIDAKLVLFGLSNSYLISEAAGLGLSTASEVFADRTYDDEGNLTPRSAANALITEEGAAIAQVIQMVSTASVTSTNGKRVPITAETICIHGDGPHAAAFARRIHAQLQQNDIEIKFI